MRNANNHAGWCVQLLTPDKGWQACTDTWPEKEAMITHRESLIKEYPKTEFRVYEVVT